MSETPEIPDFTDVWSKLETMIDQLCSVQRINLSLLRTCNRCIADFCRSYSQKKTESSSSSMTTDDQSVLPETCSLDDDNPLGRLYRHIELRLRNNITNLYQNANAMNDAEIVQFYRDHWNNYKTSNQRLQRICGHLNRYWVDCMRESNRTDIDDIFTLSMKLWDEILFKPLVERVTQACLNLIEARRNNQVIDLELIRDVIMIFLESRFNRTITSMDNFYKDVFEVRFLQNNENFLRLQIAHLEHNSIIIYLSKIVELLDNEELIHSTLHLTTMKTMIDLVERIIVHHHLNDICIETKHCLDEENYEDLAHLCASIRRLASIKNRFTEIVEDRINQIGLEIVTRVNSTANNDLNLFLQIIGEIHNKCLPMMEIFAQVEPEFIAVLDKICRKLINQKVFILVGGNTEQTARSIALFCEKLLRKCNKTSDETECKEQLNQILIAFNYIEEKDVFATFYGRMLAKRLIQMRASNDFDKLMISNLKNACSYEYTLKLEQMVKDVGVSKDLERDYQTFCKDQQLTSSIDFTMMVLTFKSWPFSPSPTCVLPSELEPILNNFTQFYVDRHNGRKLMALHQYSEGELQTCFTEQEYTLKVSTYQMVILLLFNSSTSWIVEQIQSETQIKTELLFEILWSLLKWKLLICAQITDEELNKEIKIEMNDTIQLATDFTSKKLQINLNLPLKLKKSKQNDDFQAIDDDRKNVIRAGIVRMMKIHQKLEYMLLVDEVTEQLKPRFKLQAPAIKKCIDILIEEGYLAQHPNEKDILCYRA